MRKNSFYAKPAWSHSNKSRMALRRTAVTAAMLATACLLGPASPSVARGSIISDYNLVVTGNLNSQSGVKGQTFVGGNLTGSSSDYATGLTPTAAYFNVDTLKVAGNISVSAINLNAGNLLLAGSLTGIVNYNGGGTRTTDTSLPGQVPGIAAEMSSLSSYLASMAANSSVSLPTGQPTAAVFNASPQGAYNIAMFSINAADLFNNPRVQSIQLNANGASSIIVNVIGASVLYNSGNFGGSWLNDAVRATTLWNFSNATNMTLERQFNGAILAPQANLTNTSSIEGSVFVSGLTQRAEIRLPKYSGFVPEPASILLLALASLGVTALTRRRSVC